MTEISYMIGFCYYLELKFPSKSNASQLDADYKEAKELKIYSPIHISVHINIKKNVRLVWGALSPADCSALR